MAVVSMEMVPGAIPRPGRVPEQRLLSPKIDLRWWRRCRTFHRRRLDDLGFSPQREYIGGRAMSEGGLGAHTRWSRGQGHPRHQVVWPPPGPPPSLLWTLSRVGKIGGLAFVSSNSENISCVTFLKYKIAENRNWHCGILLIG
jgi:hypothetical protein